MKIKTLKTYGGKFLLAGLAAVALSLGSAKAGQPDDQIAVQLGSIMITGSPVATADAATLAQYLVQGRAVLKSTIKKAQPVINGQTFVTTQVQTTLLQGQIFAATQAALATPVTASISKVEVALNNTKFVKVTATLTPKKTTASAINAYALKRIPNFGPELAQNGVAAAIATVGGLPVFNYKSSTTALTDAGKAAGFCFSYALKAYAKGTQNWAASAVAPFLPNFSLKTSTLGVPGNIWGISNAAAAIAANAIDGLGGTPTAANVTTLTTAMVKSANAFQTISTNTKSGLPTSAIGTIGATVTGLVSQLAGDQNSVYGGDVLSGIIQGAVKAAKTKYSAIAVGVAQGFYATYLATYVSAHGSLTDAIGAGAFAALNNATISGLLITSGAYKLGSTQATNTVAAMTSAYTAVWNAFDPDQATEISNLTGATGLNNYALVGGVPSPVTDTVGL